MAALRSDSSFSSSASASFFHPLATSSSSLPFAAPPPPPLSTHLPSHRSQVGSGGAAFSHLSSPSPSQPPAPVFTLPTASPAPPPPIVSAPATSHPLLPSISGFSSLPSTSVRTVSDVPGWGAGPSFSSGVPPSQYYAAVDPTQSTPHATAWPPASAYDPHAYTHSLPRPDDFDDSDDRFREDDHPHLDPSAHSISLDSSRSEYRRLVEYICGLFPQAVGVPPVNPPPRALFESFFAPAPHSQPTLAFNWFARVQQALIDADSCLAAWLAAGRSDRSFLPTRHSTYAVRGPHAASRQVPVNESLMFHFESPFCPSLQVGLTVRDLMTLEHFPRTIRVPVMPCRCCRVYWVSSAFKVSSLPIRLYSTSLSQPCRRVWRIRRMLPPPIPRTPATNVGTFTCRISVPTSLMPQSAPCYQLHLSLRISSSGNRTLTSCWIRPGRLPPSDLSKPWLIWFLAARVLWLALAATALTAPLLVLPLTAAVSPLPLLPGPRSGFVLILRLLLLL